MAKQKALPAHSFNEDYLKSISKEKFLKAHGHLSNLPLEKIWEKANKKAVDKPIPEQK